MQNVAAFQVQGANLPFLWKAYLALSRVSAMLIAPLPPAWLPLHYAGLVYVWTAYHGLRSLRCFLRLSHDAGLRQGVQRILAILNIVYFMVQGLKCHKVR